MEIEIVRAGKFERGENIKLMSKSEERRSKFIGKYDLNFCDFFPEEAGT